MYIEYYPLGQCDSPAHRIFLIPRPAFHPFHASVFLLQEDYGFSSDIQSTDSDHGWPQVEKVLMTLRSVKIIERKLYGYRARQGAVSDCERCGVDQVLEGNVKVR